MSGVGNELMRDSALKPAPPSRTTLAVNKVGNELMRDSALKLGISPPAVQLHAPLEMSSCATAL